MTCVVLLGCVTDGAPWMDHQWLARYCPFLVSLADLWLIELVSCVSSVDREAESRGEPAGGALEQRPLRNHSQGGFKLRFPA